MESSVSLNSAAVWLTGEGKLFAPGNLRATFDNPAYERLVNYYLGQWVRGTVGGGL